MPRVIAKILQHKVKMGQTEANNGGEEYSDDVYRILKQEHGYSINMSHKKAPANMAKLTGFSFTAKNLYDDAPDSLAMLAGYISERPKVFTVTKKSF